MRILAFNPGAHDASAAVFDDYKLVAAVGEERLTRRKGSGDGVPWLAIDEVLTIAGWRGIDVDAIATTREFFAPRYLHYPPYKQIDYALRGLFGKAPKLRQMWRHCQRHGTASTLTLFNSKKFLKENGFRADAQVFFANHHEAHALPSLFFTDWNEALVYTADGIGDNVSYSMRALKGGKLECFYGDDRWLLQPSVGNSVAQAYAFATTACGFKALRHEGKLTGLAAYGKPDLAAEIAKHFRVGDDGVVMTSFRGEVEIGRAMAGIFKDQSRETIAASIQQAVEDLILQSVQKLIARTGVRKLGLGGGLFANVRLNRLLAEQCALDEVFIFPAMGDDGLCVGAGLACLLARDGLDTWLKQRRRLDHVYLGRDYDEEIDLHLGGAAGVRRLLGSPAEIAVAKLAAGQAGAIYGGRMEYGPRALGARSILASPARADINDSLNKRLERSEFMPFAPYALEEDCDKVFEITKVNRYATRFMTITCAVKPEWKDKIPAVVHVDGTARPQIVRDVDQPLYADILRRFRAATGLPVLVNTSFNVHEEPIVNSPAECLRALVDKRIDFVVTAQAVYVLEDAPSHIRAVRPA
jgi:carbamoyltransferase